MSTRYACVFVCVCVRVCVLSMIEKVLAQRIRYCHYTMWMTHQGPEFRVTTFRLRHIKSHRCVGVCVMYNANTLRVCVCVCV